MIWPLEDCGSTGGTQIWGGGPKMGPYGPPGLKIDTMFYRGYKHLHKKRVKSETMCQNFAEKCVHLTWNAPNAECLNSVFACKSCVSNPSLSVPTLPSHTQLFLESVSFSLDMVESLLANLDSDSPTSPDGISLRARKTCSAALVFCLEICKHYRRA